MAGEDGLRILTINSGSSSLKCSLVPDGASGSARSCRAAWSGSAFAAAIFRSATPAAQTLIDEHAEFPDHDAALKTLLKWLESRFPGQALDAVGHRVVHGGTKYSQPHLVAADLLAALEEIVRLAPEHLPHELEAIRAVERHYPGLRQVACFDTAFHRQMPEVAQRFPLPRSLWHEGVLRYGFHGLSYEYIMEGLREAAGAEAARGRVIIAHLGNGASMAAVRAGKSIDTTMGLTPAGGLMMGTRSGDLDPGVAPLPARGKGTQPVHRGLPGQSAVGPDRRVGQQFRHARPAGPRGRAIHTPPRQWSMFCYQARKHLGALAAVLGGLDTLVFTAGVGANAPPSGSGSAGDWSSWAFAWIPGATKPTRR